MNTRIFTWVVFVMTTIIVLGVFVQAYFITAYVTGAGAGALDAHRVIGAMVIPGAELLTFLAAIGAWRSRGTWIGLSFLLLLLGAVQIFLAPMSGEERGNGWVHGLHGLFALVVLVLAAVIMHRAMADLGLKRGRAGVGAGTPPPAP
jgi:hypothetical protein